MEILHKDSEVLIVENEGFVNILPLRQGPCLGAILGLGLGLEDEEEAEELDE
jgi:hypothetical protein